MGIVIDLIIIGILVLSIFLGYKKGLVSLAIKFVAFIIAILVTFILYKPVANLVINTTNIDETIQNSIIEKTTEMMQNDEDNKYIKDIKEDAKNGILVQTSRDLSINIVNIAVMILLFLLIKIGLRFITALANIITKLPIIKQFNKAGGVLYGLLRGLLIIYVGLAIIAIIGQINSENKLHKDISNSYIGNLMYNNNIIENFLK